MSSRTFAPTIWNDRNATCYGRQGQRQSGVDIRGQIDGTGPFVGVQCKGKRHGPVKLTAREIDTQVAAASIFRRRSPNLPLQAVAGAKVKLPYGSPGMTECL
jgi:hypothetical protein